MRVANWPFASIHNTLAIHVNSSSSSSSSSQPCEDTFTNSNTDLEWLKIYINGITLYPSHSYPSSHDYIINTIVGIPEPTKVVELILKLKWNSCFCYLVFDYVRYGSFQDYAILDAVERNITFSFDQNSQTVSVNVPFFWESAGITFYSFPFSYSYSIYLALLLSSLIIICRIRSKLPSSD